jgi:predicted ATP-dependent endonuclease of OLD family
MKYLRFKIENFRGINKLVVDLSDSPESKVYTLVGLNESGKTTILEALAFLYEELRNPEELILNPTGINNLHNLIPKSMQHNFNGRISIKATVLIEEKDRESIIREFKKKSFHVEDIGPTIDFSISLPFEDSNYVAKKRKNTYSVRINGKLGKKKTISSWSDNEVLGQLILPWFRKNFPPIIYYPNFLLNFPDRIYLESHDGESKDQSFYRRFLQDVLDSFDDGLDLNKHIIQRVKSGNSQDRFPVEALLSKVSSKVTSLVFNRELSVFSSSTKSKSVEISGPFIDEEVFHQPPVIKKADGTVTTPDKTPTYYLEIRLKDGVEHYYIRERSLGFRWFFAFLLFTQFRISRLQGQSPVFVFDEPASNLHQTAQQRLIYAIGEIVEKSNSSVIYSTHSHHLINPNWLESTFIVKNKAIDYLDEDDFDARKTDVEIKKYKTFVAEHPDQTSFFQPILDVLEYRPSNLENIPNVVLTEGKGDFYVLKYAQEILKVSKKEIALMPGGGSNSLDRLISLYIGWGKNFVILLDSDKAGKESKRRYIDVFGQIVSDKLFTLEDIESSWSKLEIENIFLAEDLLKVQHLLEPDAKRYKKKTFHIGIQQALIQKKKVNISSDSQANLRKIVEFLFKELHSK